MTGSLRPIQVIGGGLAGLALGVGLRLNDVPVTVWETGRYPRHRVCGEVLSGAGWEVLARLGLVDELWAAGARRAATATFFAAGRRTPLYSFHQPSICISRYHFDHLLARRFQQLGGDLRAGEKWPGHECLEGFVRASGRQLEPTQNGWRWFGLKAHFRKVHLEADVEMHLVSSGYVGLCRLGDETVNACGLFRRPPSSEGTNRPALAALRGSPGSLLFARLSRAECIEDSCCAVAGLSLRPRRAQDSSDCRLGDALTMIAPFTGNGMSMALEAAEMAVQPLVDYSRRLTDWTTARIDIAQRCDTRFARRLCWGWYLHRLLFHSAGRRILQLVAQSERAWAILFRATR